MSFNPLGRFNPEASIDAVILAAARRLRDQLPHVAFHDLTRIYLHWTVGGTCVNFPDYNVGVTYRDGHYDLSITHDPRDNAISSFKQLGYATHTFHRNEGGIGISLSGMDGATERDFGPDPVTVTGLTFLCAAAAACASKYEIDLSAPSGPGANSAYAGEHAMLTHAEAANLPGNPPQYAPYGIQPIGDGSRWDLASFVPLPAGVGLTMKDVTDCGDALRRLTLRYKVAFNA